MNFKRVKKLHDSKGVRVLPIKVGMFLEIHENIRDGDASRIWRFKGMVINLKKPQHPDGTFTIRGSVARSVIEKIYPLSFPNFEKVLLMDEFKVRKSKLFFLRDKVGKSAKMKSIISQDRREIDLLKLSNEEVDNVSVEKIIEDDMSTTQVLDESNKSE